MGKTATPEDLCRDHPELLDELRQRIRALVEVDEQLNASPPTVVSRSPGEREDAGPVPKYLGRYRVEALLGEGGFGAVWRAYDPELQRSVALKVPREGTPSSPGAA